jgi:hypothetical protein
VRLVARYHNRVVRQRKQKPQREARRVHDDARDEAVAELVEFELDEATQQFLDFLIERAFEAWQAS